MNGGGSSGTDRMPLPLDEEMTSDQRASVDRIQSGPRGEIVGPFIPLLRSPELMDRVQLLGEYLRFDSTVEDKFVELTILSVARHWDQQFEWAYHAPIAASKGLSAATIEAVASHHVPDDPDLRVAVVWSLVDELITRHEVSDATYALANAEFGEEQLIELVTTAGYYTTLAMVMNFARTPPPTEGPRLSVGGGS